MEKRASNRKLAQMLTFEIRHAKFTHRAYIATMALKEGHNVQSVGEFGSPLTPKSASEPVLS